MKKKSITASKRKELVRNGKDWFFFVCVMFELERKRRGFSGTSKNFQRQLTQV